MANIILFFIIIIILWALLAYRGLKRVVVIILAIGALASVANCRDERAIAQVRLRCYFSTDERLSNSSREAWVDVLKIYEGETFKSRAFRLSEDKTRANLYIGKNNELLDKEKACYFTASSNYAAVRYPGVLTAIIWIGLLVVAILYYERIVHWLGY